MGVFIRSEGREMDSMVELVGRIMEELKGNDEERINQFQREMEGLIQESIIITLSI